MERLQEYKHTNKLTETEAGCSAHALETDDNRDDRRDKNLNDAMENLVAIMSSEKGELNISFPKTQLSSRETPSTSLPSKTRCTTLTKIVKAVSFPSVNSFPRLDPFRWRILRHC